MNHKKTILIIILVLLAFFVYWYMFISKKDSPTQSTVQVKSQNVKGGGSVSSTPYDKEFVSSLVSLEPVKLDTRIFDSKVYKALNYPETPFVINYSTDSGRDNPFLPIGIEISSSAGPVQSQSKESTTTTQVVPSNATTTEPKAVVPKPTPKTFQ